MSKGKISILIGVVLLIGAAVAAVSFLPKLSSDGTAAKNVPAQNPMVQNRTLQSAKVAKPATEESVTVSSEGSDATSKRNRFQTVSELSDDPASSLAPSALNAPTLGADPYAVPSLDVAVSPASSDAPASSGTADPFTIPVVTSGEGQNTSTGTVTVDSVSRAVEFGLIVPIYEVDVPAEEAGVLRNLYVEDFEQVQKDEKLVQIDDRQAVMAVNVAVAKKESAEIQMKNDVNVRYAKAAYDVADVEVRKADETNTKVPNTVPAIEYNRLVLSRIQASLQIEQAQQDLKVAAKTYNVQMAELDAAQLDQTKFEIHSPHDGVVMELYRKEGEWLKPGDPILHLVQMNPIRYSFRIESQTPPESIFSQPVTIYVATLNREFKGKITYIKPSHDIGDMYQVWVDIENTWQSYPSQEASQKQKGYWVLQPGMRAEVRKIGK